eukprot:2586400-Rhodomonas_salina.5
MRGCGSLSRVALPLSDWHPAALLLLPKGASSARSSARDELSEPERHGHAVTVTMIRSNLKTIGYHSGWPGQADSEPEFRG